jgi:DNA-binding CsgD family transcriptional regulator
MLRRSAQRLQGLTELTALAEAMGDAHLQLGVSLRRAAALRLSGEYEAAAELAQRVRALAVDEQDRPAELAACLELGQALLRTDMGEGYSQTASEGDLEGAREAYAHALELARAEGDEASVAAASRELGMIAASRVRMWFVEQALAGEIPHVVRALLEGASLRDDLLPTTPIAPYAAESMARYQEALDIYERLGDRRGVMSTVIAMAVGTWAPDIHLGGSPRYFEEIRRLSTRVKSFTRESERALADVQMLFGVHVYARFRGFPDVALAKGEETWNAARSMGERGLEFAAAGGLALQHSELGSQVEAERWLTRAAAVAQEAPTPLRALQLDMWSGTVAARAGDAAAMQQHFERALDVATVQGRAAARCEVLAVRAVESARLGAADNDEQVLGLAERSAMDAKALAGALPGHAPWGAQADAALARVALARGDHEAAAAFGRSALDAFDRAVREDLHLEIVLPAAEALLAGGTAAEQTAIRDRLQLVATLVAQRILDESVRVRWFGSPTGRALMRLAGELDPAATGGPAYAPSSPLDSDEVVLLRALTQARTNAEIAQELGVGEDVVGQRLATLFAKLGAASRADATTIALTGSLV